MEIVDFLLARIADDEAEWRTFETDPEVRLPQAATARLLAECEAKRRLIRACTHETENWVTIRPGVRQNMPVRVPWGDDELYDDALKFLALPYIDHADYEKSWQPG